MEGDCSELRNALARLNIHILTAGVVSQAALMLLILYGYIASRTGPSAILAATYAFEAVFFLSMVFVHSRGRNRALRLRMSSTLTRAMNGVLE